MFAGTKYYWPKKTDVDVVEAKHIFAHNVKFAGDLPSEPVPMSLSTMEELYEEFKAKAESDSSD